jgi:hypothetical protein
MIHAFNSDTIFSTSSEVNVTGARTSIESAVPEGEVIAFVLVFGIIKPAAATMGTMIKETLLPGTPPVSYIY